MAFATTTDIATGLEVAALSTTQSAKATMLLPIAQAIVVEAAGKSAAWGAALSPVPEILKGFTVELVLRGMASPQGLTAASETLGAFTRSETYRRDLSSALLLTKDEELTIRRAVYGRTSDSVAIGSHFREVGDV